MSSRLREVIMEDIPDITSDTVDRLRNLNINSIYQLAIQTPSELALEINDRLFGIGEASNLIGNARKILTERQILSKEFSTADDLLEKRNKISRYTTGSEKFDDLQDKTKTNLIGISLDNNDRQDFKILIQKLGQDSRAKSLYNIDLSDVMHFIYTQLKIPPTSKVEIEYVEDTERLLSISKIDDSHEIDPPPFSIMYIEVLSEVANDNNGSLKLVVRTDEQSVTLAVSDLSNPEFISYISQNNPDIVVFCGDYNLLNSHNDKSFGELLKLKVVIYTRNSIYDIHLLELVEKARFSYLPLKLASRYGMIRLIDSRITYELLQREFVIPARMRVISKHHEQIRTLEDIVDMDKAGMIVSPEVGIHDNVAVLDFNDEYANLVLSHNISYETLTNNPDTRRSSTDDQMGLLPEIMIEIVSRRMYLKKQLKEKLELNNLLILMLNI